jgi:ankyrin repeat protein
MAEVFISYAAEDDQRARQLAGALEHQGWSVWWDRKIVAGRAFDQTIERELETADAVVVLWSHASIASEWVCNEASAGAERGVLVPALLDPVKPPLEFRRRQAADLTRWNGDTTHEGFQALCAGIDAALSPAGTPLPHPIPRLPRSLWSSYRRRVLVAAALSVIGFAVYQGTPHGPARQAAERAMAERAFADAAHNGDVRALQDLVKRGVDPRGLAARGMREAADARYWGDGSNAKENDQLAELAFLIERGADVNARYEEGLTPLMLAARAGSEPAAAVKLLIEHGADVQPRCDCSQCDPRSGSRGCSALMIAAARDHRDAVRTLLEHGARVDAATDAMRTALMLTTDVEVARSLLAKGADVNLRDAEGRTALMWAAYDPRAGVEVAQALLDAGAKVDVRDDSGRSALTWAAAGGRDDLVALLVSKHAALDPPTVNGRTPMMLAVINGHSDVVRVLKNAGARLDLKDVEGRTALQLAKEKLNGETRAAMLRILQGAGAR